MSNQQYLIADERLQRLEKNLRDLTVRMNLLEHQVEQQERGIASAYDLSRPVLRKSSK